MQGVGFRYATIERARSLGVAGWVRNNRDGTVVAVFEGRSEALESLLAWCRRGPSGARVQDVSVEMETPRGEHGFRAE